MTVIGKMNQDDLKKKLREFYKKVDVVSVSKVEEPVSSSKKKVEEPMKDEMEKEEPNKEKAEEKQPKKEEPPKKNEKKNDDVAKLVGAYQAYNPYKNV